MTKRRVQAPIVDLETDPRSDVCLRVAAEYLGLDERTVKARIDDRLLKAKRDGKVYRIPIAAIQQYERQQDASA